MAGVGNETSIQTSMITTSTEIAVSKFGASVLRLLDDPKNMSREQVLSWIETYAHDLELTYFEHGETFVLSEDATEACLRIARVPNPSEDPPGNPLECDMR